MNVQRRTHNTNFNIKEQISQLILNYNNTLKQRQMNKQRIKQNVMIQILTNKQKRSIREQSNVNNAKQSSRCERTTRTTQEISQNSMTKNFKDERNHDNVSYDQLQFPKVQHINEIQSNTFQEASIEDNWKNNSQGEITFNQKNCPDSNFIMVNHGESKNIDQYATFRNSRKAVNEQQSLPKLNDLYPHINTINVEPFKQNSSQQHLQVQQQRQNEQEQQQQKGGVFITLEENQSQVKLQQEQGEHKNYAFDILMDKSNPTQNLEELKKKKIQMMQKKRLQYLEDKKNQENKKNCDQLPPKVKYSQLHNRKSQKHLLSEQEDNQTVQTSHRASKKQKNTVQGAHKSSVQYHPSGKKVSQIKNPSQIQKQQYKKVSPFHNNAPKTIEPNKTISKQNRSSIFAQSPSSRQKSATKFNQQPKIQPKDRKNTFSKNSNKKLMINAITYVCLPGQLNRKQRQKLIEVIENQPCEFFVFLFKQYSRKVIKGIYVFDPLQSVIRRIYGEKAPVELFSDQVQQFYRFDSGSRQFKKVDGCKSFSLAVHAVDLK